MKSRSLLKYPWNAVKPSTKLMLCILAPLSPMGAKYFYHSRSNSTTESILNIITRDNSKLWLLKSSPYGPRGMAKAVRWPGRGLTTAYIWWLAKPRRGCDYKYICCRDTMWAFTRKNPPLLISCRSITFSSPLWLKQVEPFSHYIERPPTSICGEAEH